MFAACTRGTRNWVGQVLVARVDGDVVGWALRWRTDYHRSCWIVHLYVHPQCRRHGVGTHLVDAARHRLRSTTTLRGCVWDDTSGRFWAALTATRVGVTAPEHPRAFAAP